MIIILAKYYIVIKAILAFKFSTQKCTQFVHIVSSHLTGVLLFFVLELQLEKKALFLERTERAR